MDVGSVVPVVRDDNCRLLGAVVDLFVSLAMFASGFVVIGAAAAASGRSVSSGLAIVIMLTAWVFDVILYALPVHRWGWSIGNLLTGRRVVDAEFGDPLPFRRAVRRYFARRNVPRWYCDNAIRDFKRFEFDSVDRVAGVPLGNVTVLVALAAQNWAPSDPAGPTESHADRRAGSAVVRARPLVNG
jgi:hypothetical protein